MQTNETEKRIGTMYKLQEVVYHSEQNKTTFYKAMERHTRRIVGIKKIEADRRSFDIFMREVRVLMNLEKEGANIPVIYQYFEEGNTIYIVMQYIKGETLEETLRKCSVSLLNKEITSGMLQKLLKLSKLLSQIHNSEAGYIQHKDLKPANIILKGHDMYLIDFGLSASGSVKGRGTKGYQSPEQDERFAKTTDTSRIDVFTFGLIMYEMLCGKKLRFMEELILDTATGKWKNIPKISDINPNVDSRIDELLRDCIAYNPKERLRDGEKIWQRLRKIVPQPNHRRK